MRQNKFLHFVNAAHTMGHFHVRVDPVNVHIHFRTP